VSSSRFLSQAGRSLILEVLDFRVDLVAFDAVFFARVEVALEAEAFLRVEV